MVAEALAARGRAVLACGLRARVVHQSKIVLKIAKVVQAALSASAAVWERTAKPLARSAVVRNSSKQKIASPLTLTGDKRRIGQPVKARAVRVGASGVRRLKEVEEPITRPSR